MSANSKEIFIFLASCHAVNKVKTCRKAVGLDDYDLKLDQPEYRPYVMVCRK